MLIDVKIPPLAESVTEATLGSWLKEKGDSVKEGEPIIEIETDKVILEVTAPASGVLAEILKKENDVVPSDEVIARIDGSGSADSAQSDSPKTGKTSEKSTETDARPADQDDSKSKSTAKSEQKTVDQKSKSSADTGKENTSVKTGPAVRKLMAERGLAKEDITPTGKDGRITKKDVAQAEPSRPQKTVASTDGDQSVARSERVPMSALRKRIAQRLVSAQQEYAMLTTFKEVNMSRVNELRNRYKEPFEKSHGVKLGFMSFFVLAAVEALREFPIVNASVEEHEVVYHSYIDVSIAVSAPKGLVVPVIRDADYKTMAQLEREINEYARKAVDGTLTMDDMTGGTFTITNGGIFGSMMSTPIINPPQSAILGMHSIQERPVVENGQIVARPMMYLALTYDHRIIDGREAVLFLKTVKETIEDPTRLLLHV